MRPLRGHHLFCTALFSGHGYNQAFAENMAALIEEGRSGGEFLLVQGQDGVCAACPNREEGGGCALGTEDAARRDREALAVLDLAPGDRLSWRDIAARLERLSPEDFRRVCGGCRWAREGLCSYELLMVNAVQKR